MLYYLVHVIKMQRKAQSDEFEIAFYYNYLSVDTSKMINFTCSNTNSNNRYTMIKHATTNGPVLELIRNRWSPRSFSNKQVSHVDMETILEAGSWAPSANNEQPWEYYYAFNGTPAFETLVGGLAQFNQTWAKNASVLVAAVARKTFEANNADNKWAHHDVGMANANMILQASSMGIYAHSMGGFDAHIINLALGIKEGKEVVCMIAFGYRDEADKLIEPLKERELAPRQRKPLSVFTTKL